MVFESVVTDVLNKVLGDYVVNLDKKQLKIGIWGGDVVLENLKLRENALEELNLPIQLVHGFVGKLVLKIPWKNLYGQPVVAQIEDLYLLISPHQSVEYNEEKELKYELQTKQSALQALAEAHKKELEKDNPKGDATFTEKLTAQIVNNLQIKITNVHIRYEDTTTTGKPFAFGISLHDLELYTTDDNWNKCYLTKQVSRVYKIASLDSLSVYMNCNAELYSAHDTDGVINLFRENIAKKSSKPEHYIYVLGPISSIAKLQMNVNPEYDTPPFQIPKIDLSLEMEKLNVGLTSTQFEYILKLADSMNRMQLGSRYRKYRPFNIPYKNNHRIWWKFAITAVLEEDVRKRNRSWTWEHMKEHRYLCNNYAEKYKEKELSRKPPANLLETCTLLEQKLDLFNLILIRQRVEIEIDKIKKEEEEQKATRKASWFGGWFSSGKKNENEDSSDLVKKFEAAMTVEEKNKLYQAIGYQENAVPLDIPQNYTAVNLNFKLIALDIGLYDDSNTNARNLKDLDFKQLQTILLLKFSMATCSIQQRPAANAICVSAGMKEVKLLGLDKNNFVPIIIESKITDEFNLLDVFFETNPIDKTCDQRVRIHSRPLQIIYDADTIIQLIKVFTPKQELNFSELEGAATARMANFKERSATGMQYIIDTHAVLDVDIKLMPNILIIPSTGNYVAGERSLIVISLGQLCITSQPHKNLSLDITDMYSSGKDQTEILKNMMDKAYDKLKISIDDIQVLVVKPEEQWEEILETATFTEMHILRPTSILIAADICVLDDDPRLPKTKIEILVPAIKIDITEDRLLEAFHIATSIPMPENGGTEPTILVRTMSTASSKLSVSSLLNKEHKRLKSMKGIENTLTEEIVQYTSLEVNFALKEFGILLYKTCKDKKIQKVVESPNDSQVFGTPIDELPADNEEFQDIISNVLDTSPITESQKLLSLQVLQIEAYMAQRSYEMKATAKLGAITLNQYEECTDEQPYISIIDTPRFSGEQEYLLSISFIAANRQSPEFSTKYNSTEQLIVVNFSTLNINLHQEYLLHLMEICATLQNNLNSMAANTRPKEVDRVGDAGAGSIYGKLTTIMEEDSDEVVLHKHEKKSRKVVECIKMNIIANLEQVSLVLACKKRSIASLAIKHFNAGIILKSSYTEINLCLEDIVMIDLNPLNKHSNILSIVGSNALYCQVVLYNLDETSNYNSDDMKITVEIGCMKIVFLNWFVVSVLSFLNNFQAAQNAIAQASAAAADAAKQNALDAYEKATRMKLDIRIKAPIIVVPKDSKSNKAILLDLGLLNLTNSTAEVNVPNQTSSPAIMDEIKLELRDLKLSKVILFEGDDGGISMVTTNNTLYETKSKKNILDPISCTLNVKRNLSSGWYKEAPEIDISGRLKTIELNLFMDDYALIMSILNRNLSEGVDEFPTIVTKTITEQRSTETPKQALGRKTSISPIKSSKIALSIKDTVQAKIYEQLRFNFQFDGVIANLMLNDNEGLARFGLYFLSLKGKKLIDGTLSTSIVLCDVQIDDLRPNTKSQITKYLCRKDWKSNKLQSKLPTNATEIVDVCNKEQNYMVDITAILKENDTYAEIRICGFDLLFCIDFLLRISYFLTIPEETEQAPVQKVVEQKGREVKPLQQKTSYKIDNSPSKDTFQKKINLTLYIEEPDIILIESLEDMNTNAIIFNAQAQLNYRAIGDKQIINGQIDSLKMYMCSFKPSKRDSTKHYIIHPCVISLQGSTPEEKGLHLNLKLSDIIINISPATIELLNKALNTINIGSTEKAENFKADDDFTDLWKAEKFNEHDYWFVKVDEAEDALNILQIDDIAENNILTEKCIVEIPSITIVVEHGIGYYTTPLISIDTRINTIISDWSRNLNINGSLLLSMNYYNQALAEWEPIIETNEHFDKYGKSEYIPWQLNFSLGIEKKKSELDDEIEQSTTNIKIHSEENLEITMSKTCFDLIGVLSQAFSQAIDSKGLAKPDIIAPFVIENDSGFEMKVNFQKGIFTLHECHMPHNSASYNINHSLVFVSGETVLPKDIKECTISPGGRVFLQTKDLSEITNEDEEEYNIHIRISDIDKEVILPVTRSDQRYFPLYKDLNQEPWGIVSEVRSEYGTTKINIHGVVSLRNHFTTTVFVYQSNSNNSQDKILVGEVTPGATYHLPLHTIYADKKELYFTVEGYNISIQGIKWNDFPSDLSYNRQLQCDPINTFEPFYLNIIRQKTEIYFEATNKYKLLSAFYTIHLKPPLYLRNALPISIKVSVAGCSVRQNPTKTIDIVDSFLAGLSPKANNKEDMLDYGEKEVRAGDVLHLPTVKLSGKNKEGMSFLVIRLMQYLEKDWSCTTEISENNEQDEILGTWTFSSYDSVAKMDIELFVRYENRSGSFMVTLFSPFWMINKTGLMLSYKTDSETMDVLYHPPEYKGPILFSFREKFFFDKKSASIRIDNGEWSDRIPLDIAGSIGSVTCKANDMSYEIGVHNHLTHNSLTKKITFMPFFVATNKCVFPIELQEQIRPGDAWIKVAPNACVPLWPKNDTNHMIIARVQGQQTVPFNYSDVQCTLLKLANNSYGGINVDVQSTEGGVYITFFEYNQGDAPGLIINHTSKDIMYYEKGDKTENVLHSQNKIFFTWKKPTGDRIIIFGRNKVETDLKRDGVGEFVLLDNKKAYWVSFLDGLQRVLLFTDVKTIASKSESSSIFQMIAQSIEIKIHGIGFSILNNLSGVDIMYLGITSSGVIWESKKEKKKRYKQMKILDTELIEEQYQKYLLDRTVGKQNQYLLDTKYKIDFEQMLLDKNAVRVIRRTFYPGVWINIKTSPYQMQIHAKINKIQLDNQLADCIFPVVLAPIAPPKSVATTTTLKPFVECSIVQRVVPNSNVKQYKYARILIQEFHFKVDLLFLTAIANMFTVEVNDQQAAKLFNEDVNSIETAFSEVIETHSRLEQKNFYDNLHLGPLKIHVSFSMAGSDTTALPGILSTVVQGVGVTLTDVNDVVFRLAFFDREYQFFTQRQLTSEITSHYTGQALKQLYVLVLGLDVLGNPYGLVVGLKKGVEDLFYEPFQGAIQGPGEFAEGLVLGVKSLFGHTVGGAAGAVSKITGAMGKGLAALTFDDDYQKKRRQAMNRRPANFQEGIARSGKGLVMGFVDGVTGVVTKPVAGAREEGVEGFFKGLGKGAIGLVARPTAGVVDFASGSLDAVKRATESGDEAQRLRPSRFLHQDNILRPYCLSEAKGNQLLKLIDKGKYANTDVFVHCEEIIQKQEIVIISNHRIINATKNDLFGTWTVQWAYLWHEIASISSTEKGIEIKLKVLGKKVMGLFSSNEIQRKFISVPNQAKRGQLAEILESQRTEI